VGDDGFTYTWSDGITVSNDATVTITVYNNAPYALGGNSSVIHDRDMFGQVSAYDSDGDEFWIHRINGTLVAPAEWVDLPSGGQVRFLGGDTFMYRPPTATVGYDQFTYTVTDGIHESLEATYVIAITNSTPIVENMTIDVSRQMPQVLKLAWDDIEGFDPTFGGAYDADGDVLTISIVNSTTHGLLEPYGRYLLYSPDPSWEGDDEFTFQVSDGVATSSVKRVVLKAAAGTESVSLEPVAITAFRPMHPLWPNNIPPLPSDQRVGVRWNNDDDDNDGTLDRWDNEVRGENDLVEIRLSFGTARPDPRVIWRLRMNNDNIRVWTTGPDKGAPAIMILDGNRSVRQNTVPFPVGPHAGLISLYVEWIVAPDQAADQDSTVLTFEAVDITNPQNVRSTSITLFGLQGMAFIFGGKGQKPSWPIDPNHGIFMVGRQLYLRGFDVYLYAHNQMPIALAEAKIGIGELAGGPSRGVKKVAVMGYSSGGATTFDFSTELFKLLGGAGGQQPVLYPADLDFSVYIDAIRWPKPELWVPETVRPATSLHLNFFQKHPNPWVLQGDLTIGPAGTTRNVDARSRTPTVNHFDIDDLDWVHERIRTELEARGWR